MLLLLRGRLQLGAGHSQTLVQIDDDVVFDVDRSAAREWAVIGGVILGQRFLGDHLTRRL